MVEFTYDGRHRLVEPYFLKQAKTGNLLLYGWESGAGHIKAFNVEKISALRATRSLFRPRYRVEVRIRTFGPAVTPHATAAPSPSR